ncbi:hypothetical protein J4N46_07680 [Capnocytophaga sp. Marseille-Q4570]|uniref:Uncharacterized protein n=1 Tax=Capnocytophaga bilenii TaxID=2819369 RepID=A0ABS3PYA2_9FLAO|nr:hypothetical protein [Capnocytophaga bilenii]MBO1884303.1 hypothetical protein [Capnocytophaga bilenii]
MNKKSLYITLAVVIGCLAIGFAAGYYYVDTETQKIISSREEIIKEKDNLIAKANEELAAQKKQIKQQKDSIAKVEKTKKAIPVQIAPKATAQAPKAKQQPAAAPAKKPNDNKPQDNKKSTPKDPKNNKK